MSSSLTVTNLDLPGKFAIIIDSVFSQQECTELIEMAKKNLFQPALVNIGYCEKEIKEIRNNSRWMTDDFKISQEFFNKIHKFIPKEWNGRKVSCLNERLRFLKYNPGEYFKKHYDGEYERDNLSEKSFITVQIYLNDEFQGGETNFFQGHSKSLITSVTPVMGRVLIFEHEILHEGSEVKNGTKYIIRTDVMYKKQKNKSLSIEEQAQEFFDMASILEYKKKHNEAAELYKKSELLLDKK